MLYNSGSHLPIDRAVLSIAPRLSGAHKVDVLIAATVPAVGIKDEELDVPLGGTRQGWAEKIED